MGKNTWKIIAIIFIAIFIIENIAIGMLLKIGTEQISNELSCSNDICFDNGYSSFTYDSTKNLCGCYDDNGKLVHTEIMK